MTKVFPLFNDMAEICDDVMPLVLGHSGQLVSPQVSRMQMGQRKVMRRGGEVYLRLNSWYVWCLPVFQAIATHLLCVMS